MGLNIDRIGPREWFLDVRIKRNGKELRRRETFFGTQVGAENRFLELKQDLLAGPSEPAFTGTFSELLDKYLENRGGEIPRSQVSVFRAVMRDLGGIRIENLPAGLSQYARTIRSFPSKDSGKVLSNGSINRHRAMINVALNLAVDLEIIKRNPLTKARFPKLKEVPRDKVLTQDEIQRLLRVIGDTAPHLGPLVRYNLQVPCRKSELVNMRREDLDLAHMAIRVRNGTTKNDSGTWKPIPPDMADYFRSIPPESPFLFYRVVRGRFLPLGDFKRSWGHCLRLAGIEGLRFHDGRHIAASNLVDNGTPEQVIMAVAGWKTNMLRTYYHRGGKASLGLIKFYPEVRSQSGHQDNGRQETA